MNLAASYRRWRWKRKQIKLYSQALADDSLWDFSGLFGIMAVKLRQLEGALRNGMALERNERADEIKTALEALERMAKEDYWKIAGGYEEEERLWKNDLHQAFDTIRDNVRGWWD